MDHFDIIFSIEMIIKIKLNTTNILYSLFGICFTNNQTLLSNPTETSILSRRIFLFCVRSKYYILNISIR